MRKGGSVALHSPPGGSGAFSLPISLNILFHIVTARNHADGQQQGAVMAKHTHLTDHDRLEIEHGIRHHASFRQIAAKVKKHHTTISREVLNRRVESSKGAVGRVTNRCVSRKDCLRRQLCIDKPDCTQRCSACRHCNTACPDFLEEACLKLSAPPYVCNGCGDESKCVLRKQYYLHNPAQADYRAKLAGARSGANITEGELFSLDALISPLVKGGQSVHHILVNNPDRFDLHEKTVYRYISGGLLSAKDGDMPRVCMLKPRSRKPVEHKIDKKCRIGRTLADFQAFMAAAPETRAVEMDSVIGRKGGKVLLTLMLVRFGFMFAFLRDRNDSQSVIDIFHMLRRITGAELFSSLFSVLLTDNGSEFSNPSAIECDESGLRTARVFYCDPCASWQKGHVERNHEFIRYILPKGTSFDGLAQGDIDLMMSHINSYSRPALNDKTPFDLFTFIYGEDIPGRLGMRKIPANDIVLKPALLA
jgi:transposase, IS30 family